MFLFFVIICFGFGVISCGLVWVWVLYLSCQLLPFVNRKTDKNLFLHVFFPQFIDPLSLTELYRSWCWAIIDNVTERKIQKSITFQINCFVPAHCLLELISIKDVFWTTSILQCQPNDHWFIKTSNIHSM